VVGQDISHYKIISKLGEGGMGVVYKAEDTRLKRIVALKFLATSALGDEDQKARFLREAQSVALLDHPNIAAVHDIGEVDGQTFMAIAFVDGPELAGKIKERPLKLDEALGIAIQICEGLKEAHEKGVTHRDIKPSNIMLTKKGRVKVTDFGLAHLAGRSKLTKSGTSMGTPAYMSPEQALGEATDRRSDVWGVGVVLYEMIAGKIPFAHEHEQAIIYSIINEPPEPLTALRTGLPTELDRVVGKALAKKPEERYQHVDDLLVDLRRLRKKLQSKTPESAPSGADTTKALFGESKTAQERLAHGAAPSRKAEEAPEHPLAKYRVIENLEGQDDSVVYRAEDTELQRSVAIRVLPESAAKRIQRLEKRRRVLPWLIAAVLSALVVTVAWMAAPTAEAPLRRFSVSLPVPVSAAAAAKPKDLGVIISPNGKHIAFTAERRLWIWDLDQQEPRVIDSTEGAGIPFWSPDSLFVGFGQGHQLKKISVDAEVPVPICEMPSIAFSGGSWSRDSQSVVFASGSVETGHADRHIYEVPAAGGNPELLISSKPSEGQPNNDSVHGSALFSPHFLPTKDGARVLVFAVGTGFMNTRLMLQNLDTGQRKSLGPGAAPFYSASGHILYGAEGDVWALPFSLDSLQATGEAFPVARNGNRPSVADDGTLVYLDTLSLGQERLVWLNRRNERISDIGQAYSLIAYPALSPDGRSVAFEAVENSNADIWIHDTARTTRIRLSDHPAVDVLPVWSPSGNEIAFSSYRSGNTDIFLRQSDGSGETKVLAGTSQNERAYDWSQDGRYILYSLQDAENKQDLWYLEQKEAGWEARPFLQTPSNEGAPKLSPDGRYVAYQSDRSGRNEIYVSPFPAGDRVWSVSGNGGVRARWSRDGKELFYLEDNTLMAASVSTKPTFSLGSVARLFEAASPYYDVELDGQAFILLERVGAAPNPIIQIVQNWYEEFREREQ